MVRQRTTLRRLFRYAIPYRGRLAWAVVGMIVYAVGSAGLAWLIKPIFDSVLPKQQEVALIAWGIVGVYLLKGIGSYVSSYLMADVGQRVVMDLRNDLYRHILGQSAGFFAHGATGRLLSRINNDVGQVQQAVSETAGDLARETLSLVGFAALLLYYDARLTLVCMTGAPLDRLSADPPRSARPAHDTKKSGGARAALASELRSVHRAPDRQGVRDGEARGRQVHACRTSTVPDEHEGDGRPGDPAAVDGTARRLRHGGGARVRQRARLRTTG